MAKVICECGFKMRDDGSAIVYCPSCARLFHVAGHGGPAHYLLPDREDDNGGQLWKCPPECVHPQRSIVGPPA